MPSKKKTQKKIKWTMLHLGKTIDLPNFQTVEKQNEDLRKEVATLKLELFQAEEDKLQLEEANQKLESDLATKQVKLPENVKEVKLPENVKESIFLKHQAVDESAKLRHLMAVGDNHKQIELEDLLAAEKAHSKKLEVALAAQQSIQMSASVRFTPDQTKMVKLQYDIVKEKEKVQAVTKLWHEERASLLGQLEAARTHAVDQQQLKKAEEDLVKEQRRCQELETTIQILENSKQVLAKENEQIARQEQLAKQEQLAREEQQHEVKRNLVNAVMNAERMLQSSCMEWREEKSTLIHVIESGRQDLREKEVDHLALERSWTLELEEEKDSHTKTINKSIQALEERLASEELLNTEIEELKSEIATRRNRKWYQRLLPCCR